MSHQQMRKRTSLIPLSIHEDNAFDGIEIAIKPSLFSLPSNGNTSSNDSVSNSISNGVSSRTSNRMISTPNELNGIYDNKSTYSSSLFNFYNYNTSSQTFHDGFNSPRVVNDTYTRTQPYSGTSLNNEFQNGNMNLDQSNQTSISGLEAGDLIEIRVWDEKVSDISKTYKTCIKKFPLEYKLQPKQQKDDLHENKEQKTQENNQQENKKPMKQTESRMESDLSREKSSDDNTSTTNISSLKQNEIKKDVIPINSTSPIQSHNSIPITKSNTYNNDTKNMHTNQSSPQNINSPTNSQTKTPTESTTPKSRARSFLPFGVEIADQAIRSSPNTRRRGVSLFSPDSSLPTLSLDTALNETNLEAHSSTKDISNNNINYDNTDPSTKAKENDNDSSDDEISSCHQLRLYFVMRVSQKSLIAIKETARTKISLKRQVAELYNLSSFDKVTITKVSKERESAVINKVSADFITVTIKDQFISRGEMFHVQNFLQGKWMYEGERVITPLGFRTYAREIRHGDEVVQSGIVTENTKITFRSRSARIMWLVQISAEMWNYSSPFDSGNVNSAEGKYNEDDNDGICEIYFDKFVRFMYRLFEKWKELEVTHSLTIIFFSRTYLNSKQVSGSAMSMDTGSCATTSSAVVTDFDEPLYEDHYKMVVENETRTDWESLVYKVKKAFLQYPSEVGWNISTTENGRVPSIASQGNVLEAINVTLNILQLHYMDRDLYRTGNSIVIVSPGQGVFEVDEGLARITKQRMMDNGIGSDMLSLGLPPLHIAPFFLYKVKEELKHLVTTESNHSPGYWKTLFEVPHWMHLSFLSYDKEGENVSQTSSRYFQYKDDLKPGVEKQVFMGANGFIIHKDNKSEGELNTTARGSNSSLAASHSAGHKSKIQQRNLISRREFEDILEACRPRNRRDKMTRIPSSLAAILWKKSVSIGGRNEGALNFTSRSSKIQTQRKDSISDGLSVCSLSTVSNLGKDQRSVVHGKVIVPPYSLGHSFQSDIFDFESIDSPSAILSPEDKLKLKEWGTIDFDDVVEGKIYPLKFASLHTLAERSFGSQKSSDRQFTVNESTSPSSSFNSNYSYLLTKSPSEKRRIGNWQTSRNSRFSLVQIQPSVSIEGPYSRQLHSEEDDDDNMSVKSIDHRTNECKKDKPVGVPNSTQESLTIVNDMRKQMFEYDSNIFQQKNKNTSVVKQSMLHTSSNPSIMNSSIASAHDNQSKQLLRSDTKLDSSIHSQNSLTNNLKKGGIGASLDQFNKSKSSVVNHNNTGIRRIMSSRRLPTGKEKYGLSSGGSGTGLTSSSLNKIHLSASPPLQSFFSDIPGTLKLVIPPREKLNMNSSIIINYSSTIAQSLERKQLHAGIFNMNDQVGKESIFERGRQPHRISQHSHHGHSTHSSRSHQSHVRKHKSKSRENKTKQVKASTSSKSRKKKTKQVQANANSNVRARRKPRVLNPFRLQDEEDVLAERDHNRRRWSHVFPPGEVEFKRHAGPNWKSLCQPAVLPLTIDYLPSKLKLNDGKSFQFRHYEVRLDAMCRSCYKDHSDLLLEYVTQRLIQDFQVVPQQVVRESNTVYKTKKPSRLPQNKRSFRQVEKKKSFFSTSPQSQEAQSDHTLSMGHRIHQISFSPRSKSIKIIQYHAKNAQNETKRYNYNVWVPTIKAHLPVMQEFVELPAEIRWNTLDNLICGDPEKTLTEDTPFRRLVFIIIPDPFGENVQKEHEYIQKFHRLLEYLLKHQQKETFEKNFEIITRSSSNPNAKKKPNKLNDLKSFIRCTVPLVKSRNEKYEWMDILLESNFDSKRTYHILFHWLVASGSKVEAQIQILHRRCTQYGLKLVSVPQYLMSSSIFLHPLIAPVIIPARDKEAGTMIGHGLIKKYNFVYDGEYWVDPIEFGGINDFDFCSEKRTKEPNTRQYIHNSGLIFVKALQDNKGWNLFIISVNRRITKDETQNQLAEIIFKQIYKYIQEMTDNFI